MRGQLEKKTSIFAWMIAKRFHCWLTGGLPLWASKYPFDPLSHQFGYSMPSEKARFCKHSSEEWLWPQTNPNQLIYKSRKGNVLGISNLVVASSRMWPYPKPPVNLRPYRSIQSHPSRKMKSRFCVMDFRARSCIRLRSLFSSSGSAVIWRYHFFFKKYLCIKQSSAHPILRQSYLNQPIFLCWLNDI